MRELLVTGAFPLGVRETETLAALGYRAHVQQDERRPTACPERYDAVVCNGLFLWQDIRAFRRLRLVQLTSAGADRVPLDYISSHDIRLFTAEDTYSLPMAEWAVWGILNIYKNASFFHKNRLSCRWEKERGVRELCGAHVLIYGFGSAGRAIAHRLRAFGCPITALDAHAVDPTGADELISVFDERADRRLSDADIVILTLPLTEKTRHFFDARRLSLMKDSAVFVNLARGGLVDERALTAELLRGRFSGAVLDVFEEEPLSPESPLWGIDRVWLTPHNSFVGDGNRERLWAVIQKNLSAFAANDGGEGGSL